MNLLAVHTMSNGAQFVIYLAAFILFVVAAVFAYTVKAWWATFISAGAALVTFIPMWIHS